MQQTERGPGNHATIFCSFVQPLYSVLHLNRAGLYSMITSSGSSNVSVFLETQQEPAATKTVFQQ